MIEGLKNFLRLSEKLISGGMPTAELAMQPTNML